MSKKLQKAIHKILVKDFSKAMGFNKETGVLPNNKKRFSGMPFVGFRYSEQTPKILIVGEDIGSDECVINSTKMSTVHRYIITIFTQRERIV